MDDNGKKFPPAEAVAKILENQRLEIELRRSESEIKNKDIESKERLSIRAIEAQEKVEIARGADEIKDRLIKTVGFLIALAFVLFFIGYAINHDAKDIVIELMKYIVPLVIGGFGGFYFGKSKGKEESEKD
ncbi:hypothetical protein [Pectobacterium versatile]|uniref:hypothetical protein n=1 Tax=Pectobacterium versatile TaxID=2488639 RepID=UPI00102E36FA|nr:hypothetical protein [Pectobacterium versatile]TAI99802.1 hypothetical protein EG332_04120 [Pectobacterium versatile]UEQ10453.1 hypothetical protein LLE50_04905 [Pectobacterium versatile]